MTGLAVMVPVPGVARIGSVLPVGVDPGVAVVTPDRFLCDQLSRVPDLVLEAVEGMCRRLKSPPRSPVEIAQLFASGKNAPKFGTELRAFLHD